MVWDHNRDLMYQQASTILEDPEAAKYIWGIGFHWYETWTGAGMNFENLRLVHAPSRPKTWCLPKAALRASILLSWTTGRWVKNMVIR